MSGETVGTCLSDPWGALSGRFEAEHRQLCCQELPRPGGSEHWQEEEPLGVDTCKWERAQALPLGRQGRNRPPCWEGERGLMSQRSGAGVIAKAAETSYRWGAHLPGREGRRTPWGPQKLHISHGLPMYGAHLPSGRLLCLWVPVWAPWGPPQVGGVLAGRLPCSVRRAGQDLTFTQLEAGSRAQGPAPCSLQEQSALPGQALSGLDGMGRALGDPGRRAAARCCLHATGASLHP